MQAPELVITIQDRRASHHGHQDHVGRIELSLLICIATAAVRSPAPACARLAVTGNHAVTSADARVTSLGVHVHRLQIVGRLEQHAQRQRDHRHDHLPGVRGAELAVRPEELARHDVCVWLCAEQELIRFLLPSRGGQATRWTGRQGRDERSARFLEDKGRRYFRLIENKLNKKHVVKERTKDS